MEFNDIKAADSKHIMNTYARFDSCIVSGEGATLTDINGKTLIDLTSGIGVNSLGYGDEGWVNAVSAQVAKLAHISNLYYTLPNVELATLLCEKTGYDKVFFANSGAEANEGAIKLARKYSYDKYGKGRSTIITLKNSFHGRTITTLTATGQEQFHDFFFPFTEGFKYVAANDLSDLNEQLDETVCAIIVEFVQGEGGVCNIDKDYVNIVTKLCKERDILLVADEVQTGIGRTGKLLCSEHYGVMPDVTTLAKGLGGGLPIGAVLATQKVSAVLSYGQHGTTFGGNPIACAGACEVIKRVSQPEFLQEVNEKSEHIKQKLAKVSEIEDISGQGLMLGLTLKTKSASEVAKKCVDAGVLVLTAKAKVRLLPPLNISWDELDKGLELLIGVLSNA